MNVLDGVGSEEGKIFFTTTNHIEHLDPALIRPGHIDKKIEYRLATQALAEALFLRFYSEELMSIFSSSSISSSSEKPTLLSIDLPSLAATFASIPEHEFSTADLQRYRLAYKDPVGAWVAQEQYDRAERKRKVEEQNALAKEKREEREATALKTRCLDPLPRLVVQAGPGPGGEGQVPIPLPVQVGGAERGSRCTGGGGFVGGPWTNRTMVVVPTPPLSTGGLVGPGLEGAPNEVGVFADDVAGVLPDASEPSANDSAGEPGEKVGGWN